MPALAVRPAQAVHRRVGAFGGQEALFIQTVKEGLGGLLHFSNHSKELILEKNEMIQQGDSSGCFLSQ
jgi:hypothetical protein